MCAVREELLCGEWVLSGCAVREELLCGAVGVTVCKKYQIFYFYIKYFTHKNIIYPYGMNKKSQKRFFGMVEMLILHNDIC